MRNKKNDHFISGIIPLQLCKKFYPSKKSIEISVMH